MTDRPLIISDCDEVLMHFTSPFADYLAAQHEMDMVLDSFSLADSIRHRATGEPVGQHAIWPLLDSFFETHIATQYPVAGAAEALAALSEIADVVILTNVRDVVQAARGVELRRHGMDYPVHCNQGGKGAAVVKLIEGRTGPVVFIDDLPPQHASVKKAAPHVHCLHFVGEPSLRAIVPDSPDADARIDEWPAAVEHIRRVIS